MKLLELFTPKTPTQLASEAFQRAKREESKIGAQVFGEVPKGMEREFFCLDERTWVWHETWQDQAARQTRTVRYDIRAYGIFTSTNGGEYKPVEKEEGKNFLAAIDKYNEIIDAALQPVLARYA